jgi:hypothetical protein
MDEFEALGWCCLFSPAAVALVWLAAFSLRRAIVRRARRLTVAGPPPPPPPPELVPMNYCCCICRMTIPPGGDPACPLDPCALVLVAHYNRSRADQKEVLLVCHSACFSRMTGMRAEDLLPPGAWTVGQAGGGVLSDLPPRPGRT